MHLYWGDEFQFSIFADDIIASNLASLKLLVGDREYPLHDGNTSGYFQNTLRIYGTSPHPMLAPGIEPSQAKGRYSQNLCSNY